MSNEEEENEKSIYNYNMIFNRINNYDDDTKINTDLINDIDLQNFDPKRYEYYTILREKVYESTIPKYTH